MLGVPLGVLFVLVFRIGLAHGQAPSGSPKPSAPPPKYPEGRPALRIFTDKDGLPQNSVIGITFDKQGYLWVGTQDGTAYYDGRKWNVVKLPNRIASNYVNAILADSEGAVWFGTAGGGVSRLKDGRWTTFDKSSGALPGNRARALLETRSNGKKTLWVGTENGLAAFSDGAWKILDPAVVRLPSPVVNSLLETDAPGGGKRLWVATNGGVALLENGVWKSMTTADSGLPSNTVSQLVESVGPDNRRTLWAATIGGGLGALRDGVWTAHTTQNSGLSNNNVYCLLPTVNTRGRPVLWVGTNGGGLDVLEDGVWRVYESKRSGFPNIVTSLAETATPDGHRTLWAGTNGGGLVRLESGIWTTFDTRNTSLSENIVYSLSETVRPDGGTTLWMGTVGGGLTRWENGDWTTFDMSNSGLPNNIVTSLREIVAADGRRTLWMGTGGGGVVRFSDGEWKVHDSKSSGLPSNIVHKVLVTTAPDGGPQIWAGTNGGLACLVGEQWTVFDMKNSKLPSNNVRTLFETRSHDGRQVLWVGTDGGGLVRLDRTGPTADVRTAFDWTVLDMKTAKLPNNSVRSLFESDLPDGRRELWVGTEGGVVWFDMDNPAGEWKTLSEKTDPALPNNLISNICRDRQGRMYLTTFKGVVKLTPRTGGGFDLHTFTTEDGLPGNGVNPGAAIIDTEGRLWIGTLYGAALHDPARAVEDRTPKPLRVERTLLDGKPFDAGTSSGDETGFVGPGAGDLTGAVLAHDQNNIVFECALLGFGKESETRYRFQLKGYDDRPTEWSSEFRKEYTNLGEGNYRFSVWGRDAWGNESGPVEVAFRIEPAPWRTWWAYAVYAATVAGLGYGGIQWRVRRLRRTNTLLEERIQRRTAAIAEKNSELDRQREALAEANRLLSVSEHEAREARDRALEANRAKSVFLSNMSHELRTPLNAVIGFAQLIERNQTLDPETEENLRIIIRSGEHLLGLINDVLSISKIEAGRLTLDERVFDLPRLLSDIEEMFRLRARAKDLRLAVEIAPNLPRFVRGDEGKLRQVLINLLGNAFKFTDAGGVALRVRHDGETTFFEVEDTGHGIAPDEIDKLFEAFVQTESGQKAKEGTGLGLVISRNFVRLMGGDIRVRSEAGKGTIFDFDTQLPVVAETGLPDRAKRRVIGLEPGQGEFRLLVTDDKAENRKLLATLLESVGFAVRTASDGREAVETWRTWHPHLVWMDVHMPVMDGYEATRLIREEERKRRGDGETRRQEDAETLVSEDSTPKSQPPNPVIIAISASVFEQDRKSILDAGCDDFVPKPFREATIFEKLAEFLGTRFVYENEPERESPEAESETELSWSPERLANLDPALLVELRDKLEIGDQVAAEEVIDRLAATDGRTARELRRMVESYRFDEVIEWIDRIPR